MKAYWFCKYPQFYWPMCINLDWNYLKLNVRQCNILVYAILCNFPRYMGMISKHQQQKIWLCYQSIESLISGNIIANGLHILWQVPAIYPPPTNRNLHTAHYNSFHCILSLVAVLTTYILSHLSAMIWGYSLTLLCHSVLNTFYWQIKKRQS